MDKSLLRRYGFLIDINDGNYKSYKLKLGSVLFIYINDSGLEYYEVYNKSYKEDDHISGNHHSIHFDTFISILDNHIALERDKKINIVLG